MPETRDSAQNGLSNGASTTQGPLPGEAVNAISAALQHEDPRETESERIGNHLRGFLNAGYGLIQGLGVTLRHLFEPPVTLQYPEERWEPSVGFRGIPVLVVDDNDVLACVGCMACARACPPQIIHIETSRADAASRKAKLDIDEFSIDMSRCMLCNLCVEACPFDAITMSNHFEMADFEAEGLVFDKEELVNLYKRTATAMIRPGHSWQPVGSDGDEDSRP